MSGREDVERVLGLDFDKLPPERKKALWEQAVSDRARGVCANCGSNHKVRVKMIVPLESGGQFVFENGTTLCRACEMASEVSSRQPSGSAQRPVNFWVSRRLYDRLKDLNGFHSTGALIRFLMGKYVTDSSRFDDLQCWQDEGSDVKVNVWVDEDIYSSFKTLVNEGGMTVTDALKALILMYEGEAEPLMKDAKDDRSDA